MDITTQNFNPYVPLDNPPSEIKQSKLPHNPPSERKEAKLPEEIFNKTEPKSIYSNTENNNSKITGKMVKSYNHGMYSSTQTKIKIEKDFAS